MRGCIPFRAAVRRVKHAAGSITYFWQARVGWGRLALHGPSDKALPIRGCWTLIMAAHQSTMAMLANLLLAVCKHKCRVTRQPQRHMHAVEAMCCCLSCRSWSFAGWSAVTELWLEVNLHLPGSLFWRRRSAIAAAGGEFNYAHGLIRLPAPCRFQSALLWSSVSVIG